MLQVSSPILSTAPHHLVRPLTLQVCPECFHHHMTTEKERICVEEQGKSSFPLVFHPWLEDWTLLNLCMIYVCLFPLSMLLGVRIHQVFTESSYTFCIPFHMWRESFDYQGLCLLVGRWGSEKCFVRNSQGSVLVRILAGSSWHTLAGHWEVNSWAVY